MPTLTVVGSCGCCGNSCNNSDMSMFADICNQCYDTRYVHCVSCAQLLGRPAQPYQSHRQHQIGANIHYIHGEYYCYNCYYDVALTGSYWQPKPFGVSIATYRRIGSKRKYGVEIETASCDARSELRDLTPFGCKGDCTIDGDEFDSPILYGDEGLDCIEDFLTEAGSRKWRVNSHCGCHTHYDMRDESDEQLYHIAYAYALTWPMWKRTVPRRRRSSSYSCSPRYHPRDVERAWGQCEFKHFAGHQNRYDYVNLAAYLDHTTFEVRILEGTLIAFDICNWIMLHCRFIDCVKDLSFQELRNQFDKRANRQFRAFTGLIDNAPLTDWLARRARKIGRHPLRGPGSRQGSRWLSRVGIPL